MITIDSPDQDQRDFEKRIILKDPRVKRIPIATKPDPNKPESPKDTAELVLHRVTNDDIRNIVKEELQKEREKIAYTIRFLTVEYKSHYGEEREFDFDGFIDKLADAIEYPNK